MDGQIPERKPRAVLLSEPRRVGKTTVLQQTARALVEQGNEPQSVLHLSLEHPLLKFPQFAALPAKSSPWHCVGIHALAGLRPPFQVSELQPQNPAVRFCLTLSWCSGPIHKYRNCCLGWFPKR